MKNRYPDFKKKKKMAAFHRHGKVVCESFYAISLRLREKQTNSFRLHDWSGSWRKAELY